jgi:hypothetical protein
VRENGPHPKRIPAAAKQYERQEIRTGGNTARTWELSCRAIDNPSRNQEPSAGVPHVTREKLSDRQTRNWEQEPEAGTVSCTSSTEPRDEKMKT